MADLEHISSLLFCLESIINSPHKPTVAIVGAGFSGLAAAQCLNKANFSPVIFEGRDRTGGRVHTIYDEQGKTKELGASWVHGRGPGAYDLKSWKKQMNPIYEICQRHGVETKETWDGDREIEK